MRINKYLADMGICSRREADRLIKAGKVNIDLKIADVGDILKDGDKIYLSGNLIGNFGSDKKPEKVVIAVNKPKGIVCTTTDNDRALNIVDYIGYPLRIYPIGRLDKESTGLILMTNQGELADRIMKAANCHDKEYFVTVNKCIDDNFIKKMSAGVYLHELKVKTRKCIVKKKGEKSFVIILTQGLNRQIRRMCAELGYKVTDLKRTRIMNIRLGALKSGEWRRLGSDEIKHIQDYKIKQLT
ncbi:pseudouridine synthase [Johnsonella ignava]|uniref:pseudouridine synthase n=1 Tax=Johnsonella ignava TaxID=43995 RepID=UPI0023F37F68|nr:pseudouridine synthase [Johnsonella ignava]